MSRFLTIEEKARHVERWMRLRACVDDEAPGTPDPEIYGLTDALNALDGICVVQSCAGHRYPSRKAEGMVNKPAHLWLRLDERTFEATRHRLPDLLEAAEIEDVCIRYGRTEGGGEVVEVVFAGGSRLADSAEVIAAFFRVVTNEALE